MKKKIKIVEYNSEWSKMFVSIAEELQNFLKENCIKIHHVGSTSVPELCAKPVIDVCCVVNDLKKSIPALKQAGYEFKGEYNLPMRLFFSKKKPYDRHIHVVNENSGEIRWQLNFRDYLRNNKQARDLYASTKLNLIKSTPNGFNMNQHFSEYTVMKGDVIRKIAQASGFNGYRLIIPSNYYEIKDYKDLMDLKTLDFSDKNIYHLCLYRAINIEATMCIKFDFLLNKAFIKSFKLLNNAAKEILLTKVREWSAFHNLELTN